MVIAMGMPMPKIMGMPMTMCTGTYTIGKHAPRVGSGAPGEPNFPNKQIDPIFLISLFLLNLIGQKRYTFDVRGQK